MWLTTGDISQEGKPREFLKVLFRMSLTRSDQESRQWRRRLHKKAPHTTLLNHQRSFASQRINIWIPLVNFHRILELEINSWIRLEVMQNWMCSIFLHIVHKSNDYTVSWNLVINNHQETKTTLHHVISWVVFIHKQQTSSSLFLAHIHPK